MTWLDNAEKRCEYYVDINTRLARDPFGESVSDEEIEQYDFTKMKLDVDLPRALKLLRRLEEAWDSYSQQEDTSKVWSLMDEIVAELRKESDG